MQNALGILHLFVFRPTMNMSGMRDYQSKPVWNQQEMGEMWFILINVT